MDPPEMTIEELADKYSAFLPNTHQGTNISEKVKKDFVLSRHRLAKEFESLDKNYKEHENSLDFKVFQDKGLEGIIDYMAKLGKDVGFPDLAGTKNDSFGKGAMMEYITNGILVSSQDISPDQARVKAEKMLKEYLNPKKGESSSRDIFTMLRIGAQMKHKNRVNVGVHLDIFGGYDDKQKMELAATHAAYSEITSMGGHYLDHNEIAPNIDAIIKSGMQQYAQAHAQRPEEERVTYK